MSAEERKYLLEVGDLADRLVQLCADARTHGVALDALIVAHSAVAQTHPCCTYDAGIRAIRAGQRLAGLPQDPGPIGSVH